eukprot:1461513-Prymnesium_polylepis.1
MARRLADVEAILFRCSYATWHSAAFFMVVDCEFVSPQRLSADHDMDVDVSDTPSVLARIYDLAIIICDADGNVVER